MPPILKTRYSLNHVARGKLDALDGPGDWRSQATPEDLVVESWSQGLMVGSLMIMACVTIANMRKRVKLHKLILAEQLLALWHGTFCFMDFPGYGWYLSGTATLLYMSYALHNYIAWLKIRPFYCQPNGIIDVRKGQYVKYVYLTTWALSIPALTFDLVTNYMYFNNVNTLFPIIRPYQPLYRDPWWIFSCLSFFYVMRKGYDTRTFRLIRASPRFGIMLTAMVLAIIFTGLDTAVTIHNFLGGSSGINPFWKCSLVMKCLTDAILLDDFKTEVRRLEVKRMRASEKRRNSVALVVEDARDIVDSNFQQCSSSNQDSSSRNPLRYWFHRTPDPNTFQTDALRDIPQADMDPLASQNQTVAHPIQTDGDMGGPYFYSSNQLASDIPAMAQYLAPGTAANAHMYAMPVIQKTTRRRSQYSISSGDDSDFEYEPESQPKPVKPRPRRGLVRRWTSFRHSRNPQARVSGPKITSISQPASTHNSRPHSYLSRDQSRQSDIPHANLAQPPRTHVANSEASSRPSTPSSVLRNLRAQLTGDRKASEANRGSERWEDGSVSLDSVTEEKTQERAAEAEETTARWGAKVDGLTSSTVQLEDSNETKVEKNKGKEKEIEGGIHDEKLDREDEDEIRERPP